MTNSQRPLRSARFKYVTHLVYVLGAVVIGLFVLSNFNVLRISSNVADHVRKDVERNLVNNEIARQIEILAQDQSQISFWDDAVEALGSRLDEEFVFDEIADWLWDDFGIQTTIVVSPKLTSRVAIFENRTLAAKNGQKILSENADLIKSAQLKYMAQRRKTGGGYVVLSHPVRSDNPIFAADFRTIDGQFGLAVVQAIIPDDQAVLPDGLPQTLFTFKPLDQKAIALIGKKLGLEQFSFQPLASLASNAVQLEVVDLSQGFDREHFQAVWKISLPSKTILAEVRPSLVTILGAIALALVVLMFYFGRILKALRDSESQNRFFALHDSMTGLPNRLQFDRALDDVITNNQQDRCAILCVDLDGFKRVNDTYGHQAGDVVITTVASRIAKIVGDAGIAARVGGDEFVILLHDKFDSDNVLWICDSIIESASEDVRFEGGIARVG
ncbi:MAG: diguanylate cyclase, partial [Rhizobiaceae bacterium]|nr:diguanylate cyclase [Rhizobiaceae bacterium]